MHGSKPTGRSAANPSWASYMSLLQPFASASKTKVLKILPARYNLLKKEQVFTIGMSHHRKVKNKHQNGAVSRSTRFSNKGTCIIIIVQE